MKNYIQLFLIFILLSSCQTKTKVEELPTLKTDRENISILWYNQVFPYSITEETLPFSFTDEFNDIRFATKKDTLKIKLYAEDSLKIRFILPKDTINTIVTMKSGPADFDADYIAKNTGEFYVRSPSVHELINICFALTDVGNMESNMINKKTGYYDNVISHFKDYSNHPIIDSLNKHITEINGNSSIEYYYNIRMNACMYTFNENKISNNTAYNRLGFNDENQLEPLVPLLEDFARTSNFQAFYNNHRSYYNSLVDSYYKLVPIDKMWKWLEEKFPQRYQSYKIYFSPLIAGRHSTQRISVNGFSETIMFINAPIFTEPHSDKIKEAILSRIVFTEIDHNYVNASTNKYPEVKTLFKNLKEWNNGDQWYGDSYTTFNEYMTWAVFTLYLYDNFDAAVFKERNEAEVDFMIKKRGFLKFKEFNEFVLEWYKTHPNSSLEELYPVIMEWVNTLNIQDIN